MRRVPGICRWRTHKKQLILIIAAMSLCFFLAEFTFLFSDGLEQSIKEQRMTAYGEWQVALKNISAADENKVRQLPLLENAGIIWSYGEIANSEVKKAYCIGSMDEEAIQLSHLVLSEGHLPNAEGEAAVEATLLKKIGVPVKTGERITLEITPYNLSENNEKKEEIKLEITLLVCGVIKDYSAGWCISNNMDIPGILITQETAKATGLALSYGEDNKDVRPYYSMLIKGKPEWNTIFDDMDQFELTIDEDTMRSYQNGKYKNTYAYPDKTESAFEIAIRSLRLISILIGTLILTITVWYSAKSRYEEWRDLYILGASVRDLRILLIQEGVLFSFAAMAIGISLSVIIFHLGMFLLRNINENAFPFAFSWQHLCVTVLWGNISAGAAYFFPVLQMRRIVSGISEKKGKKVNRKCRRRKVPTLWSILFREWKDYPFLSLAELILLCCIFLFPCIGIRQIQEKATAVQVSRTRSGGDYIFDNSSDSRLEVSQLLIDQLQDIYGISDVRAYHRYSESNGLLLHLGEYAEDEYIQLSIAIRRDFLQMKANELQELQALEDRESEAGNKEWQYLEEQKTENTAKLYNLDQGYYPLYLYSTANIEKIQRILQNVDEGQISADEFLKGEKAILFLPAYVYRNDMLGEHYELELIEERQINGITPSCFGAEQSITIQVGDQEVEVPIGGLIYGLEESECTGLFYNAPYSIICSDKMLKERIPLASSESYQYVEMDAGLDADYVTDKQIARLFSGMSGDAFFNKREHLSFLKQEYFTSLGFYGILYGLGTVLCLLIYYCLLSSRQKYRQEKQRLLTDLGMMKKWKLGMWMTYGIVPTLLSIIITTLTLSVTYTLLKNQSISTSGERFVFSLRVGMDMSWYLILCLVDLTIILTVVWSVGREVQKEDAV